MADPGPDPGPVNTELPRISNLQGIQATEAILNQLRDINTQITSIKTEITGIKTRLTSVESQLTVNKNITIRMQNSQRITGDFTKTLLPLLDPETGLEIPDCPNTVPQIYRLSMAEAGRILQALRVPVPAGTGARRDAVWQQFLN